MNQKDLNLFSVYKRSATKSGGKGLRGIIALTALFVSVVGGAYGAIFFMRMNLQKDTGVINSELSAPKVVETQKKLNTEVKKNELMGKYITAAKLANENYGDSKVIDSDLFEKITASMPQDVVASTINLTPTNLEMVCTAKEFMSPAVFAQSLRAKNIFFSITYDAVNKDDNGLYTFTIKCVFKKEVNVQ